MKAINVQNNGVKTMLGMWLALVISTALYCALYDMFFKGSPLLLMKSFAWSFKAWICWLFLLPIISSTIKIPENNFADIKKYIKSILILGIVLSLVVLLVQLILFSGGRFSVLDLVFYYFPSNLKVFLIIFALLQWKELVSVNRKVPDSYLENEKYTCADHNNNSINISADEILWVRSQGNYVELNTPDGSYLLRATMKNLESNLKTMGFIRIHRTCMVSKHHIKTIAKDYVETICGTKLPLSRRMKKQITDIGRNLLDQIYRVFLFS